nr:reverse transcriptase domain-containing protein [Tanacetum cinerariifolium]
MIGMCSTDYVIEGRTHSTDLAKLTRQAQPSADRIGEAPGIVLAEEAALLVGTLLMEIVLRVETALAATGINHGYHYRDRDRSRYAKRGRDSESLLSRVSLQGSQGSLLSIFHAAKEVRQRSCKIHNIKQKDGETIEDFMERFKVETGRMKGAPECMRISRFMHGVNNLELTKCLNENVSKIMEEMMITTTAFIRGEAAAAGKKKGNTSCRTHDQSKRHTSEKREITFPSLATSSGTEGPLVIEAKIGGYMIHRILLVTIGDADHSTKAWMNFMIVRSLSPYNGIIRRLRIKEIQAVPSTVHEMLKFPADGEIVTIRSTILIPAECATVITSSKEIPKEARVRHENFKVALHPNFPDQEVATRGTLSAKGRTELCLLLKENLDIFAW